jgi:hypothetical protein
LGDRALERIQNPRGEILSSVLKSLMVFLLGSCPIRFPLAKLFRVRVVTLTIGLLGHVVGFMTEKISPGRVAALSGTAKNPVGDGLASGSF